MLTRGSWSPRARKALFALQLLVTGIVLAECGWVVAEGAKRAWAERAAGSVLPWARQFHHPVHSALLPYVGAALVALAYGLVLYRRLGGARALGWLRRARRTACGRSPALLVAVLALQWVVVSAEGTWLRAALAALSAAACLVVVPGRVGAATAGLRTSPAGGWVVSRAVALVCGAGALALLVALAVEPVKLVVRPATLLNEFPQLPEQFRNDPGEAATAANDLCAFLGRDSVEFAWQSNTRGPVNHIGHVLNPLNELETGKPLRRIYFQYGLGATLAFKAVMDLAGGLSYQAYRWTFLYYLAYWALFAAGAWALLRDARYVLLALAVVALGYYHLGYIALIVAPGVNPVLHALDVPVLLAALWFFRTGRLRALAVAALLAAAAVATNGFFGPMIAVALVVGAGFYLLENTAPERRVRRLAAAAAVIGAPLVVAVAAMPRSSGGVRGEFLLGFFSWPPASLLVFLAAAYLAASYLFLLWLRASRDPDKYAAAFLSVYAQGFLVYFFWSGIENHLWPVLPYVGLHVLLMLRTLGRRFRPFAVREQWALAGLLAALALGVKSGVDVFIHERAVVRDAFASRESHPWAFARAQVISTADPAPLAETLATIERYASPTDRGVWMLSSLDKLVPFLARRHSGFRHFELGWSLLTDEDRDRAIEELEAARPDVLFVGRDVEAPGDPWEGLPCSHVLRDERESAVGRMRELRRVLDAVAAGYERVESGPLLSVYRRRVAGGAAATSSSR